MQKRNSEQGWDKETIVQRLTPRRLEGVFGKPWRVSRRSSSWTQNRYAKLVKADARAVLLDLDVSQKKLLESGKR